MSLHLYGYHSHGSQAISPGLDLQGAFTLLARDADPRRPLDETLRSLTEATARMLIVERVSLWALAQDRLSLHCLDLFELSPARHTSGAVLTAAQYPGYFAGLQREEIIVADDAASHPLTCEFSKDYLTIHSITAMLDTPVHVRSELQGVLCIEQVGLHTGWSSVQRMFAAAAASLVALALVQHESTVAQDELKEANVKLRALFEATADAIVIARADDGGIIDLNPAAERLFGWCRSELLGKPQTCLHPPENRARYRALFDEHVASNGKAPLACEIVAANGQHVAVEISAQVVDLGNGEAIVQGIFRPLPPVIA